MGFFDWFKGDSKKADKFARTVVELQAHHRLKSFLPDHLGADTYEKGISSQALKIRFAQNETAFHGATLLVQKRYAWRGFPKAHIKENPNRITILTHLADKVIGTVTVGYDSDQGLLADEVYKDKVDELRRQGGVVGELSKLAVDEELGSKKVLAGMIHIAFIYGAIHGCTDAVIEILPRHQTFYEKKLGFHLLGEERLNKRVNMPVVLMHIRLEEMQRLIEQFGGQGPASKEKSLYPYFLSPQEQADILTRLSGE
jgi:hypothetical protein